MRSIVKRTGKYPKNSQQWGCQKKGESRFLFWYSRDRLGKEWGMNCRSQLGSEGRKLGFSAMTRGQVWKGMLSDEF